MSSIYSVEPNTITTNGLIEKGGRVGNMAPKHVFIVANDLCRNVVIELVIKGIKNILNRAVICVISDGNYVVARDKSGSMNYTEFTQPIGGKEATEWVGAGVVGIGNGIDGVIVIIGSTYSGDQITIFPSEGISIRTFNR